MKILFLILDHSSVHDQSVACQRTWVKNIDTRHEIIFLGDAKMPDNILLHEVYKPLHSESRSDITKKIVKGFRHSLKKDWDYLVRCDTDVYCNVSELEKFLIKCNKIKPLYAGHGVYSHSPTGHPNYIVTDLKDIPKNKYWYFAQGGFYILSRSALEKTIDDMYFPGPVEPESEDVMVGGVMKKQEIPLRDRPDLFNIGWVGNGWGGNTELPRENTLSEHLDVMNNNFISTHKVNAKQIYAIHELIEKKYG